MKLQLSFLLILLVPFGNCLSGPPQYATFALFNSNGGICFGDPLFIQSSKLGVCLSSSSEGSIQPQIVSCISPTEAQISLFDTPDCSGLPNMTVNFVAGSCDPLNLAGSVEVGANIISCGDSFPPLPLDQQPSVFPESESDILPTITTFLWTQLDCQDEPDLVFYHRNSVCGFTFEQDTTISFGIFQCSEDPELGQVISSETFSDTDSTCSAGSQTVNLPTERCINRIFGPNVSNMENCLGGRNIAGPTNTTAIVASTITVIGVCCCLVILLSISLAIFIKTRKKIVHFKAAQTGITEMHIPLVENVKFQELIGKGNFGEVYLGEWKGINVALKTIKSSEVEDFANELRIINELRDPHLVTFYGLFIREDTELFLTTEYMNRGDLQNLLLTDAEITTAQLLTFSFNCASGMESLHRKNIIHRDLAARNLLVHESEGKLVAKVSDFGLSRQTNSDSHIYVSTKQVALPLRWLAPEVITETTFSEATDVWAFGVTLWEIFTRGSLPYAGKSNSELLEEIPKGLRMKLSTNIPAFVRDVITKCWATSPQKRPGFTKLVATMEPWLSYKVDNTAFNHARTDSASVPPETETSSERPLSADYTPIDISRTNIENIDQRKLQSIFSELETLRSENKKLKEFQKENKKLKKELQMLKRSSENQSLYRGMPQSQDSQVYQSPDTQGDYGLLPDKKKNEE